MIINALIFFSFHCPAMVLVIWCLTKWRNSNEINCCIQKWPDSSNMVIWSNHWRQWAGICPLLLGRFLFVSRELKRCQNVISITHMQIKANCILSPTIYNSHTAISIIYVLPGMGHLRRGDRCVVNVSKAPFHWMRKKIIYITRWDQLI